MFIEKTSFLNLQGLTQRSDWDRQRQRRVCSLGTTPQTMIQLEMVYFGIWYMHDISGLDLNLRKYKMLTLLYTYFLAK